MNSVITSSTESKLPLEKKLGKENVSPNIVPSPKKIVKEASSHSTPSEKKEMLERYLASLSHPPVIIKSNKTKPTKVESEAESLSLDLRGIVAETPTKESSMTPLSSKESSMTPIVSGNDLISTNESGDVVVTDQSEAMKQSNRSPQLTGSDTFRTDSTLSVHLPEVQPKPSPIFNNSQIQESSSQNLKITNSFKSLPKNEVVPVDIHPLKTISATRSPLNRAPSQQQQQQLGAVGPEVLEQAVSKLALQHQESLQQLIRQQEEERQRLKYEFQQKQDQLMREIYAQFPNLKVENSSDSLSQLDDVEEAMERSIRFRKYIFI